MKRMLHVAKKVVRKISRIRKSNKRLSERLLEKISLGSTSLTDAQFNDLKNRLKPIKSWVSDIAEHIKKYNLDSDIFAAQWGEHTQRLIAKGILTDNRSIIERLRLVWWFSGWPINLYADIKTFPILDPTYVRYQKLKAITPERFRYSAPAILGEAGWIEDSGVINHDVAILQERIQFMYFSGIANYLDSHKNSMILELGSGYGGMSLAFLKSFPECRHVLSDLPQSLAVAFSYLNIAKPECEHFVVTCNGIYEVKQPDKTISPEEAFNKPGSFVYLPNHLFPQYLEYLQPSMVFNAMSLHEMHPKAIDYYCNTVAKLLEKYKGVFCEINTLPKLPNVAIDGRLKATYQHCLEVDFPSLACRPRVWSNFSETIDQISQTYHKFNEQYPLSELFEFDLTTEYPIVEDKIIRKKILKQLGHYLDKTASILPPEKEPFTGNHLRYIVQPRRG